MFDTTQGNAQPRASEVDTAQWAVVLTEEEAAAELTRLQEAAEPWRARCRRLEGEADE